jgi:hypothetical protein
MELDTILGLLLEAKTAVQADPAKSRELALVLTKIDEARFSGARPTIKIKEAAPKGGA